MKWSWIGVAAVVAVAAGIVVVKKTGAPESAVARAPAPASTTSVGSVVLVANLAEADEPCVCGKIIRSVRAVHARGVPVEEIDPEQSPELASRYDVRVSPAVLLLDARGREVRRFEGESKETFAALQTELDRFPANAP